MNLDPMVISEMEKVILPEIRAAANDALRAYEAGTTPDGENFFDNYSLGCGCWCNLFNRLNQKLEGNAFFSKNVHRRVMSISCPNFSGDFTFYASRVDADTRVPKAGRSIKLLLEEQFFLSPELEAIINESPSSVYVLGYDLDTINGLGRITLDMLYSTAKNQFQSQTIHVFREAPASIPACHATPEDIRRPKVTRLESGARKTGN